MIALLIAQALQRVSTGARGVHKRTFAAGQDCTENPFWELGLARRRRAVLVGWVREKQVECVEAERLALFFSCTKPNR